MAEGKPLESKKFIAYLVAEVTWKIALLVVLVSGMKNGTIDLIVGGIATAIVIVAGFIEAVYVGGQAALDKYVRVAEIAASSGKSLTLSGLKIEAAPQKLDDPPTPPAAG